MSYCICPQCKIINDQRKYISAFYTCVYVIERRMKCINRSENLIFDQPTVTKQKTMCLLVIFASRVTDPDPESGAC